MYKTLVVAVDGSEHSDKSVAFAADYAKMYDSKLLILHVYRPQRIPDNTHSLIKPALHPEPSEQQLRDLAHKIVDHACEHARKLGVSEVNGFVEKGSIARGIVEFAKRKQADAIVMGSRGLSDVTGLLLGSVAHKVSSLAECTCIIVK